MFSGIVEIPSPLIHTQISVDVHKIQVRRPVSFDDIKLGDSIAVNGVCLTVEEFSSEFIQFSLGQETLDVTQWHKKMPLSMNLERSLKLSDRLHGHFVTGHVDTTARILRADLKTEVLELDIQLPQDFLKYVWKKGSLCLNGVSLTINEIQNDILSFYLIPETLKKTNFSQVKVNDSLNIEVDVLAKILLRQKELGL